MSIYIGDKEIKNLYVGGSTSVSDMQGPCPDGFHIPTYDEVIALRTLGYNIGAWEQYGSGTNLYRYLKTHGSASGYQPNEIQGTDAVWGAISTTMYRTSTFDGTSYYYWYCDETHMSASGSYSNNGFFIRPFKNSPVTPDSNWTVLYQGTGSAGIYHNSTLGLISIGNGTTWITIADKNLGATTVYNYGDTFSQANCGNCYQRGNNYGFPYNSTISSTTTKVNATNYGPGNYYSSSVYVKGGSKTYWDTSKNQNLRGGVTQGTSEKAKEVKAVYLGENKVRPPKNYRVFTISWTEKSDMSSGWTYSDDAAGLTAGSGDFDDFFGYSAVRLSTAGAETKEMKQSGGVFTGAMTTLGTLTSGDNVMIKFPVRGIKMTKSGSVVTLSITDGLGLESEGYQYYAFCTGTLDNPGTPKDAMYLGAYKGYSSSSVLKSWSGQTITTGSVYASTYCTRAKANGSGYNIEGFYQRQYINALYMMKYGNPDAQSVVGQGYTGGSAKQKTGNTDSQTNATYGTTSTTGRVKLFGLEDRWGNVAEVMGGMYTDSNRVLYTMLTGWTGALSGGENTGTTLTSTSNDKLSSIAGDNKAMFAPVGTKSSGYYSDQCALAASKMTAVGGYYDDSTSAGAFCWNISLGASTTVGGKTGARLMYLNGLT